MGRKTSASAACWTFARNDVRIRHVKQAGEAAHAPSTSSFDRAKHASLVHSTLTPWPPPSQWVERKRSSGPVPATKPAPARRSQSHVFTTSGLPPAATELGRARLRPSRQRPSRLSRSFALPKPGPPNSGGRGSVRAGKGHRGSAGASPSQNLGHRTREGEAPSEPAKAIAAQQELRPPKTWATELGRARLRPSRQRPSRLSRSFALPKPGPPNSGGRGSVRAG